MYNVILTQGSFGHIACHLQGVIHHHGLAKNGDAMNRPGEICTGGYGRRIQRWKHLKTYLGIFRLVDQKLLKANVCFLY